MAEARTVLVASGDRLFAEAASHLIRSQGWNVVGTVNDGLQALAAPPPEGTDRQTARPDSLAVLRSLTSRERLVLKLLAEGQTGPGIAARIGVSQHTVRT